MQYRNSVFVVTEERSCPLYSVGDEVRAKDLILSVTRGRPVCLSMLEKLMPLLSTESPAHARGRRKDRVECGGCEGLIRLESKKDGAFTTLQMRLMAVAERQAQLYKSDNGFAVLRQLSAFAELQDELLYSFCTIGQVQRFQPGERVVNRGEVADRIFIMLTGRVVLSEQDQHDEEETVVELAPGELIGEMGLVADTVYAFDCYCLEPASLLTMPVEQVKAFLSQHPALHIFFYSQLAKRLEKLSSSRMEAASGFSASLREMLVVELCQLINTSRKSGRVTLVLDDDTKGELLFNGGELIGARHGRESGKEAFYSLLGRNDGTFTFVSGLSEEEKGLPLVGGFMGLIMEGMQQIDESHAAKKRRTRPMLGRSR